MSLTWRLGYGYPIFDFEWTSPRRPAHPGLIEGILKWTTNIESGQRDVIAQGLTPGSSMGERAAATRQFRASYARLAAVEQEISSKMDDLEALDVRSSQAGAVLSLELIVPYTSPYGYCSCYHTKCKQLAAIDSQATRYRSELNPLFQQQGQIRSDIFAWFSTFPNFRNRFKLVGGITLFFALLGFIIWGTNAGLLILFLGLLALLIMVFTALIRLIRVQDQMAAIRQKIVRLDLAYYRLQAISTCQRWLPLPEGEPAVQMPWVFMDQRTTRMLGGEV